MDPTKPTALAVPAQRPAAPHRRSTPFERVLERIGSDLGAQERALLPRKWELLGDVLILRLPSALSPRAREIAAAYAAELGAKTVLEDIGGVVGEYREPRVRLLHGTDTETTHIEDGLRYTFDAARIMFSSGNNFERKRMGRIANPKERVVDLFAGIGYFTLPIARAGALVTACEKNPCAFSYLERNVRDNRLGDRVNLLLGDCRETAPEGGADRVLLGYIGETDRFLPTAVRALRPAGGVIHLHDAMPVEVIRSRPVEAIARAAHAQGRRIERVETRIVKSYAPGIAHVVADATIA